MSIVVVPKYHRLGEGFSKQEIVKSYEHPGRHTTPHGYQSTISWLQDLVGLKKMVILCSFCRSKFEEPRKRFGYRRYFVPGRPNAYLTHGKCDACKQDTQAVGGGGGTAFIHEEFYKQVCMNPGEARRRARAAWS